MNKGLPSKIFKLLEMKGSTGKFVHQPLFGSQEALEVERDRLKQWKATNAKEPFPVEQSLLDSMKGCHTLCTWSLTNWPLRRWSFMETHCFVLILNPEDWRPRSQGHHCWPAVCQPDLQKGELKLLACGLIQLLEDPNTISRLARLSRSPS